MSNAVWLTALFHQLTALPPMTWFRVPQMSDPANIGLIPRVFEPKGDSYVWLPAPRDPCLGRK